MQPILIFDMDGTIIDTTMSYNRLLVECYKYFSGEEIEYQKDVIPIKQSGGYNNDWDILALLFDRRGLKIPFQDIKDFYFERYCNKNFEGYINLEKPIIDKDYIAELSKNYIITLFTGRYEYEAKYTLDKFGMSEYFAKVVGFDSVGEGFQKPNPKGVNLIKSDFPSEKIYYMGDTVDDMMAAKAGNVLGIGCLPPQDKSKSLVDKMKSVGAYEVLNSTTELKSFLEKEMLKQTV